MTFLPHLHLLSSCLTLNICLLGIIRSLLFGTNLACFSLFNTAKLNQWRKIKANKATKDMPYKRCIHSVAMATEGSYIVLNQASLHSLVPASYVTLFICKQYGISLPLWGSNTDEALNSIAKCLVVRKTNLPCSKTLSVLFLRMT